MDLSRLPSIPIPDEPSTIIEPPSPYNFYLDIVSRPHGWEARVEINKARLRFVHKDRRQLVLGMVKHCIIRIRQTTKSEDLEMFLKAFEDYVCAEETKYYSRNLSNPTLN